MDEISLTDVLRVLWRGRAIIIGLTAVALAAALIYNAVFVQTSYEAQVRIRVTPFFEQFSIADEGYLNRIALEFGEDGLYYEEDLKALFDHPDTIAEVFNRLELEKSGITINDLQESISVTSLQGEEEKKPSFLINVRSASAPMAEKIPNAYLEAFERRFKEVQVAQIEAISTNIRTLITMEQEKVKYRLAKLEEELSTIKPEEKIYTGGIYGGVVLDPYYNFLETRRGELVDTYMRLEAEMQEMDRMTELDERVMASEGIHLLQPVTVGEVRQRGELVVVAAVVLGFFMGLLIVCARHFWQEIYRRER